MNVLVVVGSKHGATLQIGSAIAEHLTEAGHHATAVDPDNAPTDLTSYDAFVIGSAIYLGHWTKSTHQFIDDHSIALAAKPVWLFSSGPLGVASETTKADPQMAKLVETLKPRGHTIFAGAITKSDLNMMERAALLAVHAPYGDYRPWDEISQWTDAIIEALNALDASRHVQPSI
jgi:menaquinone-dependent protoporphyrinogen oxidase